MPEYTRSQDVELKNCLSIILSFPTHWLLLPGADTVIPENLFKKYVYISWLMSICLLPKRQRDQYKVISTTNLLRFHKRSCFKQNNGTISKLKHREKRKDIHFGRPPQPFHKCDSLGICRLLLYYGGTLWLLEVFISMILSKFQLKRICVLYKVNLSKGILSRDGKGCWWTGGTRKLCRNPSVQFVQRGSTHTYQKNKTKQNKTALWERKELVVVQLGK